MSRVTKGLCLYKNSDAKGLSAPAPGLYTCIKTWKIMYKIRLQRYCFETCNKWAKWQGFSVDIRILSTKGCLPLPRGYIHVEKTLKNVYKIRIQKDLFETCNKWSKWYGISVGINVCHQGVVCPCPGAIYMYISIKIYTRTSYQVSVNRTTGPLVCVLVIVSKFMAANFLEKPFFYSQRYILYTKMLNYRSNIFLRIYSPCKYCKNKSLAKISTFTVYFYG